MRAGTPFLATLAGVAACLATSSALGDGGGVRSSGYLDALGAVPTKDSRGQHPQGLGVLRFDADVTRWLRGRLELRGRVGGPYDRDDGVAHQGVYSLVHEFQRYSPVLEFPEAYAQLVFGRLDGRLGIQRFAWGRLDGAPPTDVLNPRDFHDPIVVDYEEQKIGVPAVTLGYQGSDLVEPAIEQPRVELAYLPIAVASRLPRLGERWFPQTLVPGRITVNGPDTEFFLERAIARRCASGRLGKDFPLCNVPTPDLHVVADDRFPPAVETANRRPPLRFDAGGIAARAGALWHGMDWNVYHYTGHETGPDVALRSTARLGTPLFDLSSLNVSNDIDLRRLRASLQLRQTTSTIHMTGMDWAGSYGGASMRVEAAYFDDRPYLRVASDLLGRESLRHLRLGHAFLDRALTADSCSRARPCRGAVDVGALFPTLDTVEWGAGIDYVVRDVFLLLQLNQTVLLEKAPKLVIDDPDNRLTVVVRRRLLAERLELELRAATTIGRSSTFVFPRVGYQVTRNLRARVGYLMIAGVRDTLIGEFKQNDEVVLELRYGF